MAAPTLAELQTMQAQLNALIAAAQAAQAGPQVVPVASVTAATTVWPQYVQCDNDVVYQVYAPLNPTYAGGMSDWIFGRPPHFVFEPSNGAKVNMPLRSANGYPLVYPTDGVKATGPAAVSYGGMSFKDDASVAAYLAASAASAAQLSQGETWDQEFAALAANSIAAAQTNKQNHRAKPASGSPASPTAPAAPAAPAVPVITNA